MDESHLELKVGALVLAAVASVLALLYFMGELSVVPGSPLAVDFSHTGGVVQNAPVKLAGVEVGRVKRIALLPTRKDAREVPLPIQMTLSLSAQARDALRSDAQVTVATQGPLGEAYLELWPGSGPAPRDEGVPLRGTDAPRLDVISNRLAHFVEAASQVLERDPEAVAKLFHGVGGLTTSLDGLISENRSDVRTAVQELTSAARDLRQLAAAANNQLAPGGNAQRLLSEAAETAAVARQQLPELSKKAQVAVGGLAALSGALTEEDGIQLKGTLASYRRAGERLDAMATRADRLLTRLEAGEGTLGAFVKDKQAYEDLKALLADLKAHPWKMLWKE